MRKIIKIVIFSALFASLSFASETPNFNKRKLVELFGEEKPNKQTKKTYKDLLNLVKISDSIKFIYIKYPINPKLKEKVILKNGRFNDEFKNIEVKINKHYFDRFQNIFSTRKNYILIVAPAKFNIFAFEFYKGDKHLVTILFDVLVGHVSFFKNDNKEYVTVTNKSRDIKKLAYSILYNYERHLNRKKSKN